MDVFLRTLRDKGIKVTAEIDLLFLSQQWRRQERPSLWMGAA